MPQRSDHWPCEVSAYSSLMFSTFFFEIGHLPDLRSDINRSQIGHLEKESSDVLKIETSLSDLKSEVSLFDVSFFRHPISDRTSISDAFFRCPI